jgi:putative transposase
MLMKREIHKRTPQEKEKILLGIQSLGVTVGCRKYNISKTLYYYWLDHYNAHGIEGLEDRRTKDTSAQLKRLEKENRILKELLAEKELESKMKDELLKKKFAQWEKKEK